MWPFDRQKRSHSDFARQTLADVPVLVAQDGHAPTAKAPPGMERWQDLVLTYADRVPIVSAACRYYSGATQRVTYDVVDANTDEPIESPDAKRLVSILNESPEELGRAVELVFLIGEARQTYGPDGLQTHGAGELVRRGDTYVVLDEKGKSTPLEEGTRAWRTWEPDRRFSAQASSSHKPMLDLLEAFVIAYAEERAVSIRLAMNTGMVLVSEDVLAGEEEPDPGETFGSDGRTRIERRLEQMLQMVITNPRNAASLQPPVLVVPGDVKDKIAHVSFAQERDKRKIQERLDMLKREYAVGTDLPADVAAGFLADLNHWNARSVDANAWKNYIAPKVQLVANNAFEELALGLGIDAGGWKVVPNGSELVEQQVQADSATKAWDRGLISDDAARKAYGFNENDAAEIGDGPEFPIGSQAPVQMLGPGEIESFATNTQANPSPEAMRVMSLQIAKGAMLMRERILAALLAAGGALQADAEAAGLTAASKEYVDPIETVRARIVWAIKAQKQDMGLAAAWALATKRAQDWFERTLPEIEERAEKAARHATSVLQRTIRDGSFEAGVARDIGRSVESVAAGGPENVKNNGDVNRLRPSVTQEDKDFMDLLRGEVETLTVNYGWQHGAAAKPFPPHEDLDGTEWRLEEERDVLDNPEDFPPSAIYYPGDHSGCTCSYDIAYEVAS